MARRVRAAWIATRQMSHHVLRSVASHEHGRPTERQVRGVGIKPASRRIRHTRGMAALGYDADFLDTTLSPPVTPEDVDPASGVELDYTHFTVRMHPARRLAWWVAWNIDGLRLFPSDSISRSGETFQVDPRIPAGWQTGEQVYADNDLDRGHIARRSDLLWGTLDEARQANSDSFFFTNITPQMADFNQSGRGGVWGLLENAVLGLDGLEDRRLSVFGGPVLKPDDPPYRGIVQIPIEHWKVVIYRLDGKLRYKSFVLTQNLDGLQRAVPDFLDAFHTYLVSLDMLEQRTALTFSSLRTLEVPADLQPRDPLLVLDARDVNW